MIDRYSFKTGSDTLRRSFPNLKIAEKPIKSYHIAETDVSNVMISDGDDVVLEQMIWGLGVSEEKRGLINARIEGLHSQSSFRFALRTRRCIIPMDSYYTSKMKHGETSYFRVLRTDDAPLFVAGLWEGNKPKTFSMITTPANRDVMDINSRMPLLFYNIDDAKHWMNDISFQEITALLSIPENRMLKYYKVSSKLERDVNDPSLHDVLEPNLTLFDV